MKSLFQLVLLWAYHMLPYGTPYENQLIQDIKLSTLADLTSFRSSNQYVNITEDITPNLAENCNRTNGLESTRIRSCEQITFADDTPKKRVKRVKRNSATTLDANFKSTMESYFTETIEPQYEPFYKWLYKNLNNGNDNIHKRIAEWIEDPIFTPCEDDLSDTPYPVPLRHQALYEWFLYKAANKTDRTIPQTESTKRVKRDLGTTPQPTEPAANQANALKQNLENHFTETIEPQYLTFYEWLFKKLDNGKISVYQKISEYIDDYFFTMAPEITNTPFPIPYKYWALYDWISRPRLNLTRKTKIYTTPTPTPDLATAGELNYTPEIDDPDTYKPTRAEDRLNAASKNLLEQHFTETIAPRYEPFYKWLYEELDHGKINLYQKIKEWINDDDFDPSEVVTNKPFPVPYRHLALYEWLLYQKGSPTKGPRPTIPTVDYDGIMNLRRKRDVAVALNSADTI